MTDMAQNALFDVVKLLCGFQMTIDGGRISCRSQALEGSNKNEIATSSVSRLIPRNDYYQTSSVKQRAQHLAPLLTATTNG